MKNRLSRKTREQFEELMVAAYKEGYQAGKESTQYKTENRHAKVGERILIVDTHHHSKADSIGKVYTVTRVNIAGSVDVKELDKIPGYWSFINNDYEVIIEEDERPLQVLPWDKPLTANQERKETIKRARKLTESYFDSRGLLILEEHFAHCIPEFIVNAKKRTVVVLLRGVNSKKLYTKGVAKCHPNDVFHADIGKVIALYKVLDKEIPSEFTDAVQPTEFRVGMIVGPNENSTSVWDTFKIG